MNYYTAEISCQWKNDYASKLQNTLAQTSEFTWLPMYHSEVRYAILCRFFIFPFTSQTFIMFIFNFKMFPSNEIAFQTLYKGCTKTIRLT